MQLDKLKDKLPNTHWVLIDNLSQVIESLSINSEPVFAFKQHTNPRKFYNSYIDFALSVYVDKFKQLYNSLAHSLLSEQYIIYAQSGRSIIENAATLRYYSRQNEFAQLFSSWQGKEYNMELHNNAIMLLDRLARGSRFSWDAFIEGRFKDLSKIPDQEHLSQTNIKTCLTHWQKDSPNLESLYDLLCDLVHPNLGSNFLVLKTLKGELVAGGNEGENISMFIICPTLAGIVGAYKTIQESLLKLEGYKLADVRGITTIVPSSNIWH